MASSTAQRPRCYGYTPDGDLIDHEATVIRGIVMSVLGGHMSLAAVVQELNDAGIPTATGGQWQLTPLVRLLVNPRLAGLTSKHRGSPTTAPAVISISDHELLAAQARSRKASKPRQRIHVRRVRPLCGLVVCTKDGNLMTGHVGPAGRSYRCPAAHTQIQADPLEAHVFAQTVQLLSCGAALAKIETVADLQQELGELSNRWTATTTARNTGLLNQVAADRAWAQIRRQRLAVREKISELTNRGRITPPAPADAARWWEQADETARRLILEALWDRVEISDPTRHGKRAADLDTGRVRLVRHSPAVRKAG